MTMTRAEKLVPRLPGTSPCNESRTVIGGVGLGLFVQVPDRHVVCTLSIYFFLLHRIVHALETMHLFGFYLTR